MLKAPVVDWAVARPGWPRRARRRFQAPGKEENPHVTGAPLPPLLLLPQGRRAGAAAALARCRWHCHRRSRRRRHHHRPFLCSSPPRPSPPRSSPAQPWRRRRLQREPSARPAAYWSCRTQTEAYRPLPRPHSPEVSFTEEEEEEEEGEEQGRGRCRSAGVHGGPSEVQETGRGVRHPDGWSAGWRRSGRPSVTAEEAGARRPGGSSGARAVLGLLFGLARLVVLVVSWCLGVEVVVMLMMMMAMTEADPFALVISKVNCVGCLMAVST